jgi:hypothetical protein
MWLEALTSALALEDAAVVDELLSMTTAIPPGALTPLMQAQMARGRARVGWWTGDPEVGERESRTAEAGFRELGSPFWLAQALLERADWLSAQGRRPEANAPLAEAREIFQGLGATPWLERAHAVASEERTEAEAVH